MSMNLSLFVAKHMILYFDDEAGFIIPFVMFQQIRYEYFLNDVNIVTTRVKPHCRKLA